MLIVHIETLHLPHPFHTRKNIRFEQGVIDASPFDELVTHLRMLAIQI